MNTKSLIVTTYVWKEWRDHRAIAIAYAIAAPLLIVLGASCIGGRWLATDRDWPTIGALVGFVVGALAFGADLVAGEMRRGTFAFLSRLPGDLRGAFVGKLLFLLAMLAGFAGWTWFCASAAGAIVKGQTWSAPAWRGEDGPIAWLAIVSASWLFAVSCWMPRGTFALPAMMLALAALLAPVIGAFELNHGMKLRDGEFDRAALWLALSGLGVAAVSFLRGWRHGGPLRSRVAWCLGSALLAYAPVWGWAGLRVREHRHLDPREPSFRVFATAFGEGGKFAFLAGYHEISPPAHDASMRGEYGATHPMLVDVATGAWREVGNPGDLFWHLGHRWERASARSLLLVEDKFDPAIPAASQFIDGFDGATGQPLTSEQWKPLLKGARGGERVFNRESDFTLLSSGERAWVADGAIVVEAADGARRALPNAAGHSWERPLGHGFVGGGAEAEYYDCTRERSWRAHEIGCEVKLIRAGGWVVMRTPAGSMTQLSTQLSLWHPEADGFRPLEGVGRGDVTALHPDGRIFVLESASVPDGCHPDVVLADGSFSLLDPESGARRELPLPPLLASNLMQAWFEGFTKSGDLLFLFMDRRAAGDEATRHFPEWIARFDPRADQLVVLGPFGHCFPDVLGCPDRDTVVFVENQRRLVRAHFDGRPAEILFPR